MASGVVFRDVEGKPGYARVGVWQTEDGIITVALLGVFPRSATQLGGMADTPGALAGLMLSEFTRSRPKKKATSTKTPRKRR
jgi:hypothetical protein